MEIVVKENASVIEWPRKCRVGYINHFEGFCLHLKASIIFIKLQIGQAKIRVGQINAHRFLFYEICCGYVWRIL